MAPTARDQGQFEQDIEKMPPPMAIETIDAPPIRKFPDVSQAPESSQTDKNH
jgi:hypothetical protein